VFYSNGNNNTRSNTNTNIGWRSALPQEKGKMASAHGRWHSGPPQGGPFHEAKDPSPVPQGRKVKQRRWAGRLQTI